MLTMQASIQQCKQLASMVPAVVCLTEVSHTSASILLVDSNRCCSTHADHNDFDRARHSAPFIHLSVKFCLVIASMLVSARQTTLTKNAIAGEALVTKPQGYFWLTC